MEQEINPCKNLPILRLGMAQTYLRAYRITPVGVYFIEATEDAQSSGQVNFITTGIILNAAGDTFRDDEIAKLLSENALSNAVDFNHSLVAC